MFYQIKHALRSRKDHIVHYRKLKLIAIAAWFVIAINFLDLQLNKLTIIPMYLLCIIIGYYCGKQQIKDKVTVKDKHLEFKASNSYLIFIAIVLTAYILLEIFVHRHWGDILQDALELLVSGFVLGRYYYSRWLIKNNK